MRFGFASIRQVSTNAKVAFRRFPLVIVCGLVAAIFAILLIESGDENWLHIRILLTATLGLPLFVALETASERRRWETGRRMAVLGAGAAVLLIFMLASSGWTPTKLATRYVQLSVAFHLLVAFLPFVGIATRHAFWQYNRILFLRFLLAALYTGVLYIGLAIALVALDNLFGIDVPGEAYAHLWIGLAFVFDPWFFLGSLPPDIEALEQRTDYPTGLKVFAQFVLIPVVTVYVLILSAYLVRVLITRTWPSGWIGWLVSSVAAAGTLALLLVHPVRDREDSRWVDAYGRWFYVALLPSIAMLLMAIFQRIDQYGFTERRYFLLVLAIWLAAIALYYAVTASRNIRLIPVTLCVVALVTLAGPWSAYAVSRGSQVSRLEVLLEGQGMFADGTLEPAPAEVPFEVRREISASLRYLIEAHGVRSLDDVAPELRLAAEAADTLAVDDVTARSNPELARAVVENALGLVYVNRYEATPEDWVNFFATPFGHTVPLTGWDVIVRIELGRQDTTRVPVRSDTLDLIIIDEPPTLRIARAGSAPTEVPLWPLVDQARERMVEQQAQTGPRQRETEPLELSGEDGDLRWLIIVPSVNGRGRGPGSELNSATADVLLTLASGQSPG